MKGRYIKESNEKIENFIFDEDGDSFYCVLCDTTLQFFHKGTFDNHIKTKAHKDHRKEQQVKRNKELVDGLLTKSMRSFPSKKLIQEFSPPKEKEEEPLPELKEKEEEEEEEIDMTIVNRVVNKRTFEEAKADIMSELFPSKFLNTPIGQERVKRRVLELIEANKKK